MHKSNDLSLGFLVYFWGFGIFFGGDGVELVCLVCFVGFWGGWLLVFFGVFVYGV